MKFYRSWDKVMPEHRWLTFDDEGEELFKACAAHAAAKAKRGKR